MFHNIALFVIMTLLSTNVQQQASDGEWATRPFHPSRDEEDLMEMCKNTFGGNDYLPKMASTYTKDPSCHFQALVHVDKDTCAAVANMRMLNEKTGWLEAVRTSEQYRNKGLAFRLLQSMVVDAAAMGYTQVLSCTIKSNTAMRRVFDKLQMKELTRIQMIKFDALKALPGWGANSTTPCQHLLESLDIQHLVSESARASKWSPVRSASHLERLLQDIQSRGGCGLMVGVYEVLGGMRLQESLDEQLVFSLDDHEHPAVMVLARDERITSLKSNWSLSLAGSHDEHLQAALWHACSPAIQAKLTQETEEDVAGFTVALEGVIPTDGPLCSALPLTEDACYVYGTRLHHDTREV